MDSFDYDSLDRYVRKFKRNIINKLESSNLIEKDLKNQSDLLCMVLDYSPKIYIEKKFNKRIEIKPNPLILEDLVEKNNTRSLVLDKQVSNEDNSYESEKEQTIRPSRFSAKLCRAESMFNNFENNKNSTTETLLAEFIKNLISDIIVKAISFSDNNNMEHKISCMS